MAKIPSIAGYESWGFKKHFWSDVEKDNKTGLPIRGTVGIDYNIHVSLEVLASGPGISEESLQMFYGGDAHRSDGLRTNSVKVSARQAKVISDFYNFTEGNQQYFFLRKGKTCIGLCRKTSGYLYKPRDRDFKGHFYMHRLSFEFVRPATPEEQIQTENLMMIPTSLEWVPMPKEALPVLKIDIVAERLRLEEDMKSMISLLSNMQKRMEILNA